MLIVGVFILYAVALFFLIIQKRAIGVAIVGVNIFYAIYVLTTHMTSSLNLSF